MLDRTKTALVIVDVQEAFRSVIPDLSLIASRISIAARAFDALGSQIIVTEQYPAGLGRTVEEVLFLIGEEVPFVEKSAFSAWAEAGFRTHLEQNGIKTVALCGIETHICVLQTALDLIKNGYDVHLLCDSVASRFEHDRQAALARILEAGATSSSVEMVLFEMLGDSRDAAFKAVQSIIK
ncbi:MAG: isochorismatase family protein [Acidobacteria bacterium]|nr:isochorismatase family protein [Acidobacteriota bacterium]